MNKTLNFKIYFYNGFNKPEIVANSIDELIKNVTIYDSYTGDKTDEMIEELEAVHWNDIGEINEALSYYDMLVNPTLEQLVDTSMKWFNTREFPYHLLEDFGSRGEIYSIVNRTYDDFKAYPGYAGKYIIENYIRHTYYDSVIDIFDTLEAAEAFMNDNELWDDAILLGVNHDGRAFYPSF